MGISLIIMECKLEIVNPKAGNTRALYSTKISHVKITLVCRQPKAKIAT